MGSRKNKNRRPNKPPTEGLLLNNATYNDYLDRFRRIALSIFSWENLPDTMDGRYIEECLYSDGQASLLFDPLVGYLNTRATSSGALNIYGLPNKIHCYSYTAFNQNRKLYTGGEGDVEKDAVLVMNDWDRTPTLPKLELFALRLMEAQRTADINIASQRTPILILTDQDQLITTKNAYSQFNDNEPVIVGDKNSLSHDTIKAIKTDAPFIADKINDYKREIWNEFLTYMGINNLQSEKKERLINSETASNNEVINLNMQAMLAPRQKACEQFNALTGLNISVKVRSDLNNIVKNEESAFTSDKTEAENE